MDQSELQAKCFTQLGYRGDPKINLNFRPSALHNWATEVILLSTYGSSSCVLFKDSNSFMRSILCNNYVYFGKITSLALLCIVINKHLTHIMKIAAAITTTNNYNTVLLSHTRLQIQTVHLT